jgi:hypothetical protein
VCDYETSTKRGGPGPYRAVEPLKKKRYFLLPFRITNNVIVSYSQKCLYLNFLSLSRVSRDSTFVTSEYDLNVKEGKRKAKKDTEGKERRSVETE